MVGEAPQETMGRVRLPGAVPIESARSRGEKRHIAITPSGAMSAVSAQVKGSGYWEPARTPAAAPTRPAPPAPGASHLVPTAPAIPIPMVVESGGPRSGANAPTGPTGAAMATTAQQIPPAATEQAAAAVAPPTARPAVPRRKPVPYIFQLSRATSHPRASAGGGKVLPRAYVGRRQTPTSMGAVTPEAAATSTDIERPLEQAVEPPLAPELPVAELAATELLAIEGAEAIDVAERGADEHVDARREIAPFTLDVEETVTGKVVEPEATPPGRLTTGPTTTEVPLSALRESEVIEGEITPPAPAGAGADATDLVTSSPGDVVEEWDVVARERAAPSVARADAVNADVLARIRQQAHRPGRVVSRDVAPPRAPREPREPGRILVAVTTVILALALIVALAVIFRRAPTAPW